MKRRIAVVLLVLTGIMFSVCPARALVVDDENAPFISNIEVSPAVTGTTGLITLTAYISDPDGIDANYAGIHLQAPDGTILNPWFPPNYGGMLSLDERTIYDGIWKGTVDMASIYNSYGAGTYKIFPRVADLLGYWQNLTTVFNAFSVEVKISVDTIPPATSNIIVAPTIAHPDETITVSATFTDSDPGVKFANIYIMAPDNIYLGYWEPYARHMYLVSGTVELGTWKGAFSMRHIYDEYGPGTYKIWPRAADMVDNLQDLYESMALAVDIVVDETLPPPVKEEVRVGKDGVYIKTTDTINVLSEAEYLNNFIWQEDPDMSNGARGALLPGQISVNSIQVPSAGSYQVWVRYNGYSQRFFTITVEGASPEDSPSVTMSPWNDWWMIIDGYTNDTQLDITIEAKGSLYTSVDVIAICEPQFPMQATIEYNKPQWTSEYANEGIHQYNHNISLKTVWTGPGNYNNFPLLDNNFYRILTGDPNAHILVRVDLNAPSWWEALHPDELVMYHDGVKSHQSFASQVWRTDTEAALRNLITYIKNSPYGNRVTGYVLCAGQTGEWQIFGGDQGKLPDYSAPALTAYRSWLDNKYGAGYGADKNIPTKAEREREDLYVFRNPSVSQNVIDYQQFLSELTAETIIYFADIVKQEVSTANGGASSALCGAFYGYLLEHSGLGFDSYWVLQNSGHLALNKILSSASIDFLCAPVSYRNRKPGQASSSMAVVDSIKLHGKAWYNENDIRTFLAPPGLVGGGYCRTYTDTVNVLKREFFRNLIKNTGFWWMKDGWYSDPDILALLGKMQNIGELKINSSVPYLASEIAVIVDEKSPYYMTIMSQATSVLNNLVSNQRESLGKIGAPYDIYLLDDLLNSEIPEYKLYIFLNTFYIPESTMNSIKTKIQKNQHTILWLYAPGFIDDVDGLSTVNIKNFTNITVDYSAESSVQNVNITNFTHPYTQNIGISSFGTEGAAIGPIFYSTDANVTVLGKDASNRANFVVKKILTVPSWTSVFITCPAVVPAEILRNIARDAGVHIYVDTAKDAVYANDMFLGLHTSSIDQMITIELPQAKTVKDAFSDELIGTNITEFQLDLPSNNTSRLFLLE